MSRVRTKDTNLELLVCSALRTRGITFAKHVRTLPGSPDLVFVQQRVAVFVDGDFWHGYRLPIWEHKLKPFWRKKLWENRARDQRNFRKLRRSGWHVIRIWQHQLKQDLDASWIESQQVAFNFEAALKEFSGPTGNRGVRNLRLSGTLNLRETDRQFRAQL